MLSGQSDMIINGYPTMQHLRLKQYQVSELRQQLNRLSALLAETWPSQPSQSAGSRQAIYRDDARIFAQFFGSDATRAHVADMLAQDPADAAVFLRVASDLLEDAQLKKSTSFAIESRQEKMEFGPVCAFVLFRLRNLSDTNPALYRQPIFL